MNCEEFLRLLPDDLRSLSTEQELHAEVCPSCSAVAHDRRCLADKYGALAHEWKSISAPPYIEGRVLAAYRANARTGTGGPRRSYSRFPMWAPVAAMIALLAAFLINRYPTPQHRPQIQSSLNQAESLTEVPAEPDEEFLLLPDTAQIMPDEEVDIVRVEVPRSSMIALGYPVSDVKASENVEADVVLGADGVARAVRFVDE